ncbi:MAG TPA: VanZ family protein [Galbitalea sp.]|jgi:glycopeptide antibiotics resistance protein
MIDSYVPGPTFPGLPLLDPILRDVTFAALLVVVVIALVRLARRRTAFGPSALVAVLLWLAAAAWLTMEPGDAGRINLVPFSFGSDASLFEPVSNVLLFVPLGLLLRSFGWRLLAVVGTGLAVSLIIEVTQYLVNMGRTADINDLVENTIGTLLGSLVAVLLGRMANGRHTTALR